MRSPRARLSALAAVAAAAATASWLLAAPPAAAVAAGPATSGAGGAGPGVFVVPQHPGPPGVPIANHPLLLEVRGHTATGRPLVATGAPGGYTATQLRAYLKLHGTGAGQTVAIVDAFDDPYALSDLTTYSKQFSLPLPCTSTRTSNCFPFQRVHPYGVGSLDTGWVAEETLDVEMVHSLAPRASIVLVEAHDDTLPQMFRALAYAAGLHPAVISNSYTLSGEIPTESSYDHYCQLAAGVCTSSTGDLGYPGAYPAYNPSAVAVGGTTLSLTADGTVTSETAWDDSGGGVSQYEPRPAYQNAVNPYAGRAIPDVSFDADLNTGVAIYSAALGGWLEAGGTSVGAPAWAGILASADQLRVAAGKPRLTAARYEVQRALYGLSSGLYDVKTGSNGACGSICTARPGYDFVTGLGSPRPGIDTALAAAP
jgi:subtilase family serine protease